MIHEFAVEPEVMATWQHFQSLWDDFGVGKGRLLVEYPGNWRRRIHELAPKLSAPVKANAISSKISAQRHKFIGARGRPYEPERLWLANAKDQQASALPFRAIVAHSDALASADVLVAGDFDRDAEPWKVHTQLMCPRKAGEMVGAARPLLTTARELILVDPHFDGNARRFTRTLAEFVGQRTSWSRLELHTAMRTPYDARGQQVNLTAALARHIPRGTTLTVFFWQSRPGGEQMHARYLLTEMGGMHFDFGLDEDESGTGTTQVTLLEHEFFLRLRRDFAPSGTTFVLAADAVVRVGGCG